MASSRFPIFVSMIVAMALMPACAPIPDLGTRPEPRTADAIAATTSLPSDGAAWPADDWWTRYRDPQLTRLVEEGLANSPDVAAAAARIRRAAGFARQTGAARLPSLDLEANGGVTKQSYNMGLPKDFVPKGWLGTGSLALDLNFDLDLWGRNKAALAADTSEVRAAEIDGRQARLMLTTGIADAYADLARLFAERDIQQRTIEIRVASQKLVSQREGSGLETRGNLRQADATVASARAELLATDELITLRRHQIAALIGAGPDRGLSIARPRLDGLAPAGVPADVTTALVARRPDIAAALARTEAEASRVKVARADFFPAIRLGALVGLQSLGYETLFNGTSASGSATSFIDRLFERDSLYGNAGPAITLPLFRGGALSGQYRAQRATYDEAVATYDKTVLTAYQEVADAVTSRQMLARRLADARSAQTASEEAYSIAQQRYRGGLSTYLDVLNVEDRLLVTRQAVATLDARAFALDVALVRALGGGFSSPDPKLTVSKDDRHG